MTKADLIAQAGFGKFTRTWRAHCALSTSPRLPGFEPLVFGWGRFGSCVRPRLRSCVLFRLYVPLALDGCCSRIPIDSRRLERDQSEELFTPASFGRFDRDACFGSSSLATRLLTFTFEENPPLVVERRQPYGHLHADPSRCLLIGAHLEGPSPKSFRPLTFHVARQAPPFRFHSIGSSNFSHLAMRFVRLNLLRQNRLLRTP
jgi:hypothetical protein